MLALFCGLGRQDGRCGSGHLSSSNNHPVRQACLEGTHLGNSWWDTCLCCVKVWSLFLEQVLDASLGHSSTDLAKPWVMSTCARKNSASHLAYFPGSHPTSPGYTRSLMPHPWLVITSDGCEVEHCHCICSTFRSASVRARGRKLG